MKVPSAFGEAEKIKFEFSSFGQSEPTKVHMWMLNNYLDKSVSK